MSIDFDITDHYDIFPIINEENGKVCGLMTHCANKDDAETVGIELSKSEAFGSIKSVDPSYYDI